MVEGEDLGLLLEVTTVVPLDYRVFDFANPTQVTVDLHYLVRMLLVVVLIIRENCLLGRLLEVGLEPFD